MQYLATYFVNGRRIEQKIDPEQTIGSFIGHKVYVRVVHNLVRYTLDMTKMILLEPHVNLTQGVRVFLEQRITDKLVEQYRDESIPVTTGGKFTNRLVAMNGHAEKDVTMSFTSITEHDIRNDPYRIADHNDLVLTAPKRDMSNYLVSVNGVFHHTTMFENELYVADGFHNMRNSKKRLVGLYDTKALGGHTTIPITMDNVKNTPEEDPWRGVYLSFPGVDFRNKTVLLVFAGYLYILDGYYQVVGQRGLKINTCKMDPINQWLHNPNTIFKLGYNQELDDNQESDGAQIIYHPTVHERIVHYLQHEYPLEDRPDATRVALQEFRYNDLYSNIQNITRTIEYAKLRSTAFLYKLLTSKHSFLVVIDNPKVYLREYELERTFLPDQFQSRSHDTPRGILRYNMQQTIPFVVFSDDEHR